MPWLAAGLVLAACGGPASAPTTAADPALRPAAEPVTLDQARRLVEGRLIEDSTIAPPRWRIDCRERGPRIACVARYPRSGPIDCRFSVAIGEAARKHSRPRADVDVLGLRGPGCRLGAAQIGK